MDNLDPATGNPDPIVPGAEGASHPDPAPTPDPVVKKAEANVGAWKSNLGTDLRNSPLMAKFEDTTEGLNKAIESHANLEQLLGHDKVPIPKGVEDVEGWNRFSKAMGIPDKAESYGLADAKLPESMQGMTMDKGKFAEIAHAHKLTPAQAKGLWETYQQVNIDSYNKAMADNESKLTDVVNRLKSEWGDTYDVNVELGQAVINKFSDDQEGVDFITSVLAADPRGVKFLAKIGDQFAENKIPEFQMKRFSLAPEEAKAEMDKIRQDLNGPYMNTNDKFTNAEHIAAMDRYNHLQTLINKAKGQA